MGGYDNYFYELSLLSIYYGHVSPIEYVRRQKEFSSVNYAWILLLLSLVKEGYDPGLMFVEFFDDSDFSQPKGRSGKSSVSYPRAGLDYLFSSGTFYSITISCLIYLYLLIIIYYYKSFYI